MHYIYNNVITLQSVAEVVQNIIKWNGENRRNVRGPTGIMQYLGFLVGRKALMILLRTLVFSKLSVFR